MYNIFMILMYVIQNKQVEVEVVIAYNELDKRDFILLI